MGVTERISGRISGIGSLVAGISRAFLRGRAAIAAQNAHDQSLAELAEKYVRNPTPGFRSFLDSLNNLPGPVAVVSTTVMVGLALVDPAGFAARMNGLNEVPEPVWWIVGGLVSLYFGAREVRFARGRAVAEAMAASIAPAAQPEGEPAPVGDFADNAALRDWAALKG